MTAEDAAGLMAKYDVGAIPVLEETLVGSATDRDLVVRVLAAREDPARVQLGSILRKSPIVVSPDARLSEARELMGRHRARRLPVVKETTGMKAGPSIGAPNRS
jgi:CBS domain-containing protein